MAEFLSSLNDEDPSIDRKPPKVISPTDPCSAWTANRRDPICFSPHLYRARNLEERYFNKINQCRHIATRYDKPAANYLAFIKLASIRLWLRTYESTRPRVCWDS